MSEETQFEDLTSITKKTKLAYGVLFGTEGAVSHVEDWLDDNSDGEWSLIVEGMDDDLIKKSLRISFELEADKVRFIDEYARA